MPFNKLRSLISRGDKASAPKRAGELLDKLVDGASINPKAFRSGRTSRKRALARDPIPTAMERVATTAFPEESSLPARTRSARGKRKEAAIAKSNARMKAHAEALAKYREESGNRFASVVPGFDWANAA